MRIAEDLRVPTLPVAAEVVLAHGQTLQGTVFLPELADHHPGRPHPEEWLNGPARFLPLRLEKSDHVVLINKRQVVMLTVPVMPEDQLDHPALSTAVQVVCGGFVVQGTVMIDLPPDHSRLLDFMNLPEEFFAVIDGQKRRVMHKRHVIRIEELTGPPQSGEE